MSRRPRHEPTPSGPTASHHPLLEVDDVATWFRSERGLVRAVDGVSLTLDRGAVLGIVGESGSGKSVLSRSIMGLLPRRSTELPRGRILFNGDDLRTESREQLRQRWGRQIGLVSQDPMTSLNPVVRIDRQITEGMRHHLGHGRAEARRRALELLNAVGIPEPERRLREYPHELSGGMRQRVTIAIALACDPLLLLADEPTTALDVTVQAQILDLLEDQVRDRRTAMVLVTHDLGVAAGRTDEIAVMYAGRIVEKAPTGTLFTRMCHPYTQALFTSIPRIANASHTRLPTIPGRPPDLVAPPKGCSFHPRCRLAQPRCLEEAPPLESAGPGHDYACFHPVGTERGAEALARNVAEGRTAAGTPVDDTVVADQHTTETLQRTETP